MLKACVIGCGVISQIHIPVLLGMEDVRLVAVCDIDPAKKPGLPDPVHFYTDYKDLYEKEHPDVAHICLPHYLHYPVSKFFADHGVHVFCEKPAARDAYELEQFIAVEDAHPELKIGICFQNRFNDTSIKLRELVGSGEYGKILGAFAANPWQRDQQYYNNGTWRGDFKLAGGGCMINQAIHLIDLMGLVCGPVRSVKGVSMNLLDLAIDVEDTAVAKLDFENGARGVFFATLANSYNAGPFLEIRMEKAIFQIDSRKLYQLDESGERKLIVEDKALEGSKFYYGSSHGRLIRKFYDAIEQDTTDYVHVKDARLSNQVIDAIVRSGVIGKEILL
ncbi:MAG: Gfo/Idh/MocA family oxidoreductase [Firmicutes bacterium]|nr:Gfo/Idh/MocA family oxidoreductase [Bacillota bacterium]